MHVIESEPAQQGAAGACHRVGASSTAAGAGGAIATALGKVEFAQAARQPTSWKRRSVKANATRRLMRDVNARTPGSRIEGQLATEVERAMAS